jgi:YD repeat-containing protein
MFKTLKITFLISLFILILSPFLLADDTYLKDPFYTEGHLINAPAKGSVYEYVDPFSGYLTLVHTDIFLPGNGGLDLRIMRTYNSCIWGRRDTSFPGLIAWNENSPVGIGWSLHMGIVRNPYGTGSANRFLPDNPVVEMPDGSQHILFKDRNNSTRFISREYWIYKNVGTGKWELTLTDGTKYIFEYNTNAGYATFDGVQVAQVTSIEHPNGVSKITIYYDKRNGYSYIDKIRDSTGRYVYFYYDFTNHRLTKISGAGITYNYYYTTIDSKNFLIEVKPPEGNSWKYTYYTSTYELDKITYPYGGTIEYDYSDVWFNTGVKNVLFKVVTQRRTGGRDVTPGTWTYNYDSGGSSGDVTTIYAPDNFKEVYTHYGWGNCGNGDVWRIGLLMSKKVYKSNSLIYAEEYTWSKSASYISTNDLANANWSGTGGRVYDGYIYVPLLTSKSITRDGKTYTTNYSNYDSYGNPGSISETGDAVKTTIISHWYNTSKNIVKDKPSSVTISGSFPGTFATTYSYDSDGNVTQLNKYGVITIYSYHSNGNLYYKRDANNNTTYYEWDKGVIDKITTPEYTINRIINNNGTIANETNGRGYTTYFTYDGNLRLTSIDPPAGNTIYFTYPSDSSYKKESRGSYYIYYYYDGFGRPSGTHDSKGVDTQVVYSAYGIKDYTDSEIGDKIYYDEFGRIEQIVHKDGNDISYSYSGSNVTIINERGKTTIYTYNAFGDPDEKFLISVKDPNNNIAYYDRNMLGSLTSISYGGVTRTFTYNSKNFLISETYPETGTIYYGRDNVGNMTSRRDSHGTRYYYYDGVNRLIQIKYGTASIYFGYDEASNRTSMTNPSASVTYTYDSANRLTQKSERISGRTYITSYAYDGNDNIVSITYPSGHQVTYGYNLNNEVTSVSGFGVSVTSFSYNLASLPTSFSYSNGKSTSITYTSRYLTDRITSSGAIDIDYSYDPRGNVTGIIIIWTGLKIRTLLMTVLIG